MVENLSDEKVLEYRVAFAMYDKDKDGKISTKELGSIMRNLGQNPTEKELLEMIAEVDQDQSGTIEFNEFISMIVKRMKDKSLEEEVKEAFKIFDKDRNNSITTFEFREVIKGLPIEVSDDEINEMVLEADQDGDGDINCVEFVKMMTKNKIEDLNKDSVNNDNKGCFIL
jgi:calmodulin